MHFVKCILKGYKGIVLVIVLKACESFKALLGCLDKL